MTTTPRPGWSAERRYENSRLWKRSRAIRNVAEHRAGDDDGDRDVRVGDHSIATSTAIMLVPRLHQLHRFVQAGVSPELAVQAPGEVAEHHDEHAHGRNDARPDHWLVDTEPS